MNKVYDVRYKDDNTYYAVGGINRTHAILNYLKEIGVDNSEFIHYRATAARDQKNKPIHTDKTGFVDMAELIPKGYRPWWSCPNCGNENDFKYLYVDKYICSVCGHVDNIPFAEY